jgi:uncharacterized protein YndB with AHSA1/START domain
MRLLDNPSVAVTRVIAAPAAAVWALVSDINLPARFSSEFQGARWTSGEATLGAVFRGDNRRGESAWSTDCYVIAWEPERLFAWAVEDTEHPVATWQFELDEAGATTTVTFRATLGDGESGVTEAVAKDPARESEILESRMAEWRRNMEATLEGVATLLEA